jgi:hypothetical protein
MIIHISAKCSDLFSMSVYNAQGQAVGEYDGYVPDFFPGEHYGDYVALTIDTQTGKILNWKKVSDGVINELLEKQGNMFKKAY